MDTWIKTPAGHTHSKAKEEHLVIVMDILAHHI